MVASRNYTHTILQRFLVLIVICTVLLLLTGGFTAAQAATGAVWTRTNPTAFPTRGAHSSVVFDNKMWAIGGSDASGVLNDVHYSTNGAAWTQATGAAAFAARSGHTSVNFSDKMWVIGGDDLSGSYVNDVWHSTDGAAWTSATGAAAFAGRIGHSSVVYDNKMWVIGGDDGSGTYLNDVWYSTDGAAWTQATGGAAFAARSGHSSVVFDNKMWVIGGDDGSAVLNDVWYSTDGAAWTQATGAAGFLARSGHSSVVFDNKMWVIGGYGGGALGYLQDVWYSMVPPTVTGITPATGANTGTVSITNLAGTGFVNGATVKLTKALQADIAGTSVTWVDATNLTCNFTINGAAVGTWDVVVTNPDTQTGTLTGGFTVTLPPPTVTGITPLTGYRSGTVSITNLAGTGFVNGVGLAVKLTKALQADIIATNVVWISATKLTCDLPITGAPVGSWDVVVTNPDTQTGTLTPGFTVLAVPPSVTGITPATGINTGTVSITNLAGTDFVNGATVKLTKAGQADILATNVVWVSATQITCDLTITGATAGDWTVLVTNPDTQNSLNGPNNPFQLVALAIANSASNAASNPSSYQSSSDSDSGTGNTPGAGTGQNAAPAEPGVQGAPASPAATGAVTAELSISDQGVISQSTDLQSADGRASVSIDAGVVALDQAGAPVSSVSIDTLGPSDMPDVPQGGAVSFAGIAYDLGPNGAQFSPAISITFAAPPGQVGQDFTVRTYDHATDTWQDLPTTYDPQTGTVTAEVSLFCCFALFAKTVTTAPTAPVIAATIAATHVPTQLIPTKIAPPSPTIATTFLGIVLTVINLLVTNPVLLVGIAVLAVGIVLMVWKQRRDRLYPKP